MAALPPPLLLVSDAVGEDLIKRPVNVLTALLVPTMLLILRAILACFCASGSNSSIVMVPPPSRSRHANCLLIKSMVCLSTLPVESDRVMTSSN